VKAVTVTRILYLDCFSGAAGDMLLGACVDAGLPVDELTAAIEALGLGARLRVERVRRSGIDAAKVSVEEPAPPDGSAARPHRHRHLPDILGIIGRARLPEQVKTTSAALFERLGAAEADVHGIPIDRVHFHEVGAVDSIVDIVGTVFALNWFGAGVIVASPLNTGSGTVRCEHGVMPVPAPATARLLAGVPVYAEGPETELLTPTGALLVTHYASGYGPPPPMVIERVGYGAGDRDFKGRANVVRLVVGRDAGTTGLPARSRPRAEASPDASGETLLVLECEIDDLNPQLLGWLMPRLLEAGAHDVYYTPVQMKKNRPGTLVTVLAPPSRADALIDQIFAETTTLGIRSHEVTREAAGRETHEVVTPYGPLPVKVGIRRGRVVNVAPEFEASARAAAAAGVPVKEVLAAAVSAWHAREKDRDAG
jgi:uncharacterized protein (TIGR00299 family) protein